MTVMHRASPAPAIAMRVDDGESIVLGKLRLQVMHTPGHTADSMCLVGEDRVFTGDTLLIGGTGRTDLPSGDPEALYDSLFGRLLELDPALLVYPAHDYKGRSHSTIGAEIATNPRLQQRDRAAFVQMMKSLDLSMPTHLTEALRTNMSGGKTVGEMLAEATACVPFMSMAELRRASRAPATSSSSSTCARGTPTRPATFPARASCRAASSSCASTRSCPTRPRASSPAASSAASRRSPRRPCATMGFQRAVALDGGMKAWLEAGYPVRAGAIP